MTTWKVPQGYLLIVETDGQKESFYAVAASHPGHAVATGSSAMDVIGKLERREIESPRPLSTFRSANDCWSYWCPTKQRFLELNIQWNELGFRRIWSGLTPPLFFVTDSKKKVIRVSATVHDALVAALTCTTHSLSDDEDAQIKSNQSTGISLMSIDGLEVCHVLHRFGTWSYTEITATPEESTHISPEVPPPTPPVPRA